MWDQLNIRDADIRLCQAYLSQARADALFEVLRRAINWRRDRVRVFGRCYPIPRLHQWYADAGLDYRWSGLNMEPEPWFEELESLRDDIAAVVGAPLNSVLANLYRDGSDSMGWHADDEPELGKRPIIVSLSLGAARDFVLRHRNRGPRTPNRCLRLANGSLLVMAGDTQKFWQHALPKRRRITRSRINLTFRQVVSPGFGP